MTQYTRRRFAATLATVTATGALAGCTGDSDSSDSDDQESMGDGAMENETMPTETQNGVGRAAVPDDALSTGGGHDCPSGGTTL